MADPFAESKIFPHLATRSSACARCTIPCGIGTRTLPIFPADAQGHRHPKLANPERGWRELCHGWLAVRPICLAPTVTRLKLTGPEIFNWQLHLRRNPALSAYASTAWRAALEWHAGSKIRSLRRDVIYLDRLYAAIHPPGLADGASSHDLCLHPTRLNRWAKTPTHQPIEQPGFTEGVSDYADEPATPTK